MSFVLFYSPICGNGGRARVPPPTATLLDCFLERCGRGRMSSSSDGRFVLQHTAHDKNVLRSAAAVDVAGTNLPVSSQLKSLGVIIDSHMRFDSHVGVVVRACNYHIRVLRKRHRPFPAASSRHESTTATRCCVALLLQSSRSCGELKTTSPGSSVSSADVSAPVKFLHWLLV